MNIVIIDDDVLVSSALKTMISSIRLMNSGLKYRLTSVMYFSSRPSCSNAYWLPRLLVMISSVFLKSTVTPLESVIRPSSRIC